MRAKASTSAVVELTSPAGPIARGSIHAGARVGSPSSSTPVCPLAARNMIASSGRVVECVSPSGVISSSRIAWSQLVPVIFSITRPASTKPELQYDIVAPSGWFCATPSSRATYFSRVSSPRPVSVKTSPSIPLVCVRRWRIVTVRVTSGSEDENSGTYSTIGASRSSLPSSTSRITTEVVHTLLIEPIWNTESSVVSIPVRALRMP
nr:hypothetical protein [Microbacterium sp. Se63.02b]